MYQRALVSVAKGTEAIAYIGAFGIVAFGNNGICLHSGKCQKRQRIAGNREKGIWDSGESHSSERGGEGGEKRERSVWDLCCPWVHGFEIKGSVWADLLSSDVSGMSQDL